MIGKLYKTTALLLILSLLLLPNNALAANTYSTDLELSSSQYWSVADTASLSVTGDISIEAWIKLEQLPSTAGSSFTIIAKDNVTTQRSYHFYISRGAGDKLRFTYHDASSNYTDEYVDTGFDGDDVGQWIHTVVTADVSAKDIKFYINGSEVNATQQVSNATSIKDSTATFQIGARNTGELWDGLIDDVRVWNDVRTPEEIAANYQKELVGNEAGLVGYWKFNNDGLDETSNNNDLTNNNTCTFSTSVPFTGAARRIILIE